MQVRASVAFCLHFKALEDISHLKGEKLLMPESYLSKVLLAQQQSNSKEG